MITLADVQSAAARIQSSISRTPFLRSQTLSALTGAEVWIKFENLQFTASFKERGALNRLLLLSPEERRVGVVAVSAGNHAQGVARHAQRLNIPAKIVMPEGTPFVKIKHTEAYGAEVVIAGKVLTESFAHAEKFVRGGWTLIHPYNDADVIAGQGTVGLEIVTDAPDIECIVVPVGGGGLLAGISAAAGGLKPGIEIIGVQSASHPSFRDALYGVNTPKEGTETIAEGIAVKAPGNLPLAIVRGRVADILIVKEKDLERAVSLLINVEKSVAEGAGAASLAALLHAPEKFRGKKTALVLSGGNIDARMLASVLMRDLVREGRIARLRVEIKDSPGTLAKIAGIVAGLGGNIIEVSHQRIFAQVSVKAALLDLAIETRDASHMHAIRDRIEGEGFPVRFLDQDLDAHQGDSA